MPRAERETLILDVAGVAFGRGDYHSASMDEIAEMAGISKPMLYAYFGSKEGLYGAYIARTGRELRDRLIRAGALPPHATAEERIREPVEEFLLFVDEYGDGWRVLFRDVASETVGHEVAGLREQIAQGVVRLIEDALEDGAGVPPGAALDAVAHAIVGAGEALANWWLDHPAVRREDVARWYASIVQAAVGSLARGQGPDSKLSR